MLISEIKEAGRDCKKQKQNPQGLPMTHGLRVFDTLTLTEIQPLQVCPVRGTDPLNWQVSGVFAL